MTSDERAQWRQDGKIPTRTPASEAATPADEPETSQAAPTGASAKVDSEPTEYKTKTAQRINELLEGQRRANDEAANLRRELAALRQPPTFAKPADPKPVADSDPEPDPAKYEDLTKYFSDKAEHAARKTLRAYVADQETRTKALHADAEVQKMERNWNERVTAAKTKHADFDPAAAAQQIPAKSLVDAWINENEPAVSSEMLYHLQKNPGELQSLLTMPLMAQVRELVKLEAKVSKVPKVKLLTDAPDPSPNLGVRNSDALNETDRAIKNKDVRAYREARNREELARRFPKR